MKIGEHSLQKIHNILDYSQGFSGGVQSQSQCEDGEVYLQDILFEAPGIEIILQEPYTYHQADIVYVQNSVFHNYILDKNHCSCCSTTSKLELFSTSSVVIGVLLLLYC